MADLRRFQFLCQRGLSFFCMRLSLKPMGLKAIEAFAEKWHYKLKSRMKRQFELEQGLWAEQIHHLINSKLL